jgi:hypothetical protein
MVMYGGAPGATSAQGARGRGGEVGAVLMATLSFR